MKKKQWEHLFKAAFLVVLILLVLVTEHLFHHSFEKFILNAFQRIDRDAAQFSNRITVIDTSPIYNLPRQRTDRQQLAALLQAVKWGQPTVVGMDIRLDTDSLYPDTTGDSALKAVLADWKKVVIPKGVDPYFEIADTSQIANIQINDGYEIPVVHDNHSSLAFQMARLVGIQWLMSSSTLIVNYQATSADLAKTGQVINAAEILKIYHDPILSTIEKQDALAMMLASQLVIVGFCNDALNVDRHETPLGQQAGVIVWANTLNNLLNPNKNIDYFSWWLLIGWLLITLFLVFQLKRIHDRYNFYYIIAFAAVAVIQIVFWFSGGAILYFVTHIYLPVFSFILVGTFAFPIYKQLEKLFLLVDVIKKYPKIRHLPAVLQNGYIKYLKEPHPFKRLHLSFTLIEECVRFSVLLGLAQAQHNKIPLNGAIAKQKWDRKKLSGLTFGEWHNLMRTVSKALYDSGEIIEEWKLIYWKKDDRGVWENDKLLESLDNKLTACEEFAAQEPEHQQKLAIIDSMNRISNSVNNLLPWLKNREQHRKTRKKPNSSHKTEKIKTETEKIIESNFGQVQHLIQLRNRIIHDGGVFIGDKNYSDLIRLFETWLKIFLEEKLNFWKQVKIYNTGREANITTWMVYNSKTITISPFLIYQKCIQHLRDELFLLSVVNSKQQTLTYYGTERHCRLFLEKREHECEQIFDVLELPE